MEPSVSIDVELDGAVNYAMQQNGVPIIKQLRVSNLTDETLNELTVTNNAQPEFFAPNVIMLSLWAWRIGQPGHDRPAPISRLSGEPKRGGHRLHHHRDQERGPDAGGHAHKDKS